MDIFDTISLEGDQSPQGDIFDTISYTPEPADDGGTRFGDYTRAFGIGLDRFGQLIGRGLDVAGLDTLGQWTENLYKERERQLTGEVSPAMKAEQAKTFFEKDEEGRRRLGAAWKSPEKIASTILQSAPQTAVGMAGGLGMTGILAKTGMSKALSGMVGAAIGEGGMAAAESAKSVYDTVFDAPEDVIINTEEYQEVIRSLEGNPSQKDEQARKIVARKAATHAAAIVGGSTAILGAPSGAFLGKIIGGEATGPILARIAKGAGLEALQEAPQSSVEKLVENYERKRFVDPEQDLWEGVDEAAAEGGISGIAMGGVLSGFAKPQGKPPEDKIKAITNATTIDEAIEETRKVVKPGITERQKALQVFGLDEGAIDGQAIEVPQDIKDAQFLDSFAERFNKGEIPIAEAEQEISSADDISEQARSSSLAAVRAEKARLAAPEETGKGIPQVDYITDEKAEAFRKEVERIRAARNIPAVEYPTEAEAARFKEEIELEKYQPEIPEETAAVKKQKRLLEFERLKKGRPLTAKESAEVLSKARPTSEMIKATETVAKAAEREARQEELEQVFAEEEFAPEKVERKIAAKEKEIERPEAIEEEVAKLPQKATTQLMREATQEVEADPIYGIMQNARSRGIRPFQLSDEYDADTVKELKKKFPAIFVATGRVNPDEFAAEHGMTTDQFIQRIQQVPSKKAAINKLFKQKAAEWLDMEEMAKEDPQSVVEAFNAKHGTQLEYQGIQEDFATGKPAFHTITDQAPKDASPTGQSTLAVNGGPLTLERLEAAHTAKVKQYEAAKPEAKKEELKAAEAETETKPTEAQIEAGNYKKGKINLAGFTVSIENPAGSTRSGQGAEATTPADSAKAQKQGAGQVPPTGGPAPAFEAGKKDAASSDKSVTPKPATTPRTPLPEVDTLEGTDGKDGGQEKAEVGDKITFTRGGREYTERVDAVYGEDQKGELKNTYRVDLFGPKYIKKDDVAAIKKSPRNLKKADVKFAKSSREIELESYQSDINRTKEDNANLVAQAKQFFGTTTNPEEAGYILPSGEMLDFSGKHQVGPSQRKYMRERSVDHRELHGESLLAPEIELDISQSGTWGMMEFMARTGALRFDHGSGVVNAFSQPTVQQLKAVGSALRGVDVTIELVDKQTARIIDSAEIDSATPQKIRRFFDNAAGKTTNKNSPMYAKGQLPAKRLSTVQQIATRVRAALTKQGAESLLDAGKVKIVQSVDDLRGILGKQGVRLAAAFHGSPHRFEKFSTENIGTGEGVQAYGYGLYFASRKDVAEWYKNDLSKDERRIDTGGMGSLSAEGWARSDAIKKGLPKENAKPSDAISILEKEISRLMADKYAFANKESIAGAEELIGLLRSGEAKTILPGALYQVELAPSADEYLLWDDPITREQSDFLSGSVISKKNLGKVWKETVGGEVITRYPKGSEVYGMLSAELGKKQASDYLHSIGVRGIKYLDGTSRAKGEGNYNYVIFSDEDVTITAKYAKDGSILGATLNGVSYLVADNLDAGNTDSTIIHELVHGEIQENGWEGLLGKNYDGIKRQVELMRKAGHKGLVAAHDRAVKAGTKKEDLAEETMAYAIADGSLEGTGLWRRIKNAIRAWLVRHGIKRNITVEDLRALAESSIRRRARSIFDTRNRQAIQFSPYSDDIRFSKEEVIRHAKAIYSKLQEVASEKFTGMKAQGVKNFLNKHGVKKAEIEATGIDAFLADKKPTDKVTQEELENFVKANAVELDDVVLGATEPKTPDGWTVIERLDGGYTVWDVRTEDGSLVGSGPTRDRAMTQASDLRPSANVDRTGDTHFSQYTEPGSVEGSYREMFVTAPGASLKPSDGEMLQETGFTQEEWDSMPETKKNRYRERVGSKTWEDGHSQYESITNPVVRIRFNTVEADGKTILRIEEIQGPSDANQKKMPAHLRDNIYQLGVKRILAYAKENGFDGVALATKPGLSAGSTQADRYSLDKQLKELAYNKVTTGNRNRESQQVGEYHLEGVTQNGSMHNFGSFPEKDLPGVVGKEMAEKIINGGGVFSNSRIVGGIKGSHVFSDIDLRVGSTGLKKLYDTTIPAMLEAYGKGKMGGVDVPQVGHKKISLDSDTLGKMVDPPVMTMPTLLFTDKTPASYPMFAKQASGKPLFENGFDIPEEGTASKLWQTLIFKAQNKFNALDKVQKLAAKERGLEELPESEDASLAEIRYHGQTGAKIEDFQEQHVEPLVESIFKAKLDLKTVEDYMLAKHAPEANAKLQEINPDREDNEALSGMSNEQASEIIQAAKDSGKQAELEAIAKRVYAITKAHRNLLRESGLEKNETIDAWENAYQFYVPTYREEHDDLMPPKGSGFDTRAKQKRRIGSTKEVSNILAHTVANYEAAIIRSEKAKVGRALLEFAENNPSPLWEVDKVEYKPTFNKDGLVQYRQDPGVTLADNVLVVKVDGENRRITFDKNNQYSMRIVSAMKNLGAESSGVIVNALSKVNRMLAMVNTGLNPEFIISNLFRDLQTAGYNLSATEADKVKWRIIKDVGKAWKGIRAAQKKKYDTEWSRYFEEFRQAGGKTGWLDNYANIKDRHAKLETMLKDMGDGNLAKVKRGLLATEKFIDDHNTAVENAIRLSAFVHARKNGVTVAKAAKLAKELTVNFNRKGEMGQALNAMYLFYNASVQGSARVLLAAKHPKVQKLIGATVVAAAFLDMANRASSDDDDDGRKFYDKIPDHVKERNLIIMNPFSGKGDYFKIPLPWGYNVFHVFGQELGRMIDPAADKYDAGQGAIRVAGAVVGAFNPVGGDATITQMLSPTVTDPFVQWAENKDWAGRPLRPESNPFDIEKPESQKYFNSVREPSRWVSERLNALTGGDVVRPGKIDISPELFDLTIDTVTGGAGRFLSDIFATPIKALKGDTVETYTIPFARKIYGSQSASSTRNDYYDNLESIKMAKRQFEHYSTDPVKRAKIRKKYEAEIMLAGIAKESENRMGNMRKFRKNMEKRGAALEQMLVIEERMIKEMNRFNALYRTRTGARGQ